MRILDLEAKTDLERATIRFYEKEGLISPRRTENGYREYSETDCGQLMKIKLLRQLGLSVEKIKALQQGNEDFQAALEEQIRQLSQNITNQKIAREVCSQIRDAGVDYQSIDASYYLTMLKEAQPKTAVTTAAPYRDPVCVEIHPVRRYIARILDYMLLCSSVLFILIVILRIRPISRMSEFGNALATLAFWLLLIPANALFLHFAGTTPGKWVMGIRVESFEGGRLPFLWALDREWRVFRYGMGFCIPLWTYFCQLKAWWRLKGTTPARFARYDEMTGPQDMVWDDQSELIYSNWEYGKKGLLSLVGAICLCIGLNTVSSLDIIKPKYRGYDLTVAQFASNYNDMTAMLDRSVNYRKMGSDGSFADTSSKHTIVVDMYNQASSISYETEDAFIRKIRFEYSSESALPIPNPINNHYDLLLLNAFLSQGQYGTFHLKDLQKQLTAWGSLEDGHVTYKNLEIIWNGEPENCVFSGGYYIQTDEAVDSKLRFSMELIIHPN